MNRGSFRSGEEGGWGKGAFITTPRDGCDEIKGPSALE